MIIQKTSLVCTVLNEEKTIEKFIDSILKQSVLPSEIIIVDGGSSDETVANIKYQISNIKKNKKCKKVKFKVFIKKGNRSVGRNEGIKHASSEIILLTDSGCILDKNWIKEIMHPFKNKNAEVVAGYYKGYAKTSFQKALIPYVLVMPDKVNPKEFLPATRSMAVKKSVWKKIGGFNEKLSHNEDYDFANRLKEKKTRIIFTPKAIVSWIPRKNIIQAFKMFFRFAYGDAEAGILRTKVILLFLRYFLLFYLSFLSIVYKSLFLSSLIFSSAVLYIVWSILKNSKYVTNVKEKTYLPLIQIIADLAVGCGTILGFIKKFIYFRFLDYIKENKILFFFIALYSLITLSQITWGIPNSEHPFLYHMDEWHQLQAVREVFKVGSPNLVGAANGTMFHFFYSGLYLLPFIITNIVNPFAIKSAIDNMPVQHNLFIVLRLETLLLGILTILVIDKISTLLRLNKFIIIFLFIVNPLWLMLSNYFKYDIGLMFWLVLSLYTFLKYYKYPTTNNFIIAGVISALALSVKVSALPVLLIYIISYIIFTPNPIKNIKRGILGLLAFILTLIIFGIPDLVFGGYSIYNYIFDNLVSIPNTTNTISIGYSYLSFVFLHHFPTIFGHALYIFFILSFVYFLLSIKKNIKIYSFLIISLFIFLISLIPLKLFIVGNRALVLLPFMVIVCAYIYSDFKIQKYKLKTILIILFIIIAGIQTIESFAWVVLKNSQAPQEEASLWILKNIPRGSIIGLENIPIYQFEPDIVLKEFYEKQYGLNDNFKFQYRIVDYKSKIFPKFIIISNVVLSKEIDKNSVKLKLIKKIEYENYKLIYQATPKFKFYKYFGNNFNYMYSGLIGDPVDISIYEKK